MKEIRLLKANEIECRVATINEKGVSILLYKDARVDQKILDETFTPLGWKKTYQSIDGNLFCTVEIYDPDKGEWIQKQDVGVASYSEPIKGSASDAFKRASFCVGVGRELYSAPFIWISADKIKMEKKENRWVSYEKFSVQYISYNEDREIASLIIVNGDGKVLYEMKQKSPITTIKQGDLSDSQIRELKDELYRTGVPLDTVLRRYGLNHMDEMTAEIYIKAIDGLKRSRSKAA